ncbi:MAG: methylated-DNA--[protein]-cysteine S-methyltransferase [Planctomycetota bacterium]|nr:methylated-DNA--[protein]-cysteine S-methyltransferase [Planctomycetota bacterium]
MAEARKSFDTPAGRMAVVATPRGLARVVLPKELAKGGRPTPSLRGHADQRQAAAHAAKAEREIIEYLDGRRREFTVPVDMAGLPPFHTRVLRACLRIPYGKTLTYAALAERAGSPRAARAVGQAMARNPLALVVPCHRVVAAGGGLGGYGGGLDLKRRLLKLEGAM